MLIGQNVVRYVSNSSWSRTITNENTYWTIIIFNFETVITFSYFWMLSLTFGFFLTVFQGFDDLTFSLRRRVFCSFQKQSYSYINRPTK